MNKGVLWCQEISLDPEALADCYRCLKKVKPKTKNNIIKCMRELPVL